MTNRLEREIPADRATANTAKRNLTAVMAVPKPGESVISREAGQAGSKG
jgi:hypothetical protein